MKIRTDIRRAALALLVLLCSFSTLAAAQKSGPRVTAQLSSGVIKLGSVVSCVVQVDGARSASLEEVPAVEGLRLEGTGGPSVQDQMRFSGRQRYTNRTITWVLKYRPDKVGDFVIPPMRLEVDNKPLYTRELTLSVVKDMEGQDLGHLEFEGIPERVYEGQPFTITMTFGWDVKLNSLINEANLILPWWNELPGALEVDSGTVTPQTRMIEVHVNQRVRIRAVDLGERKIDDKTFRMLSITRSYVATRPGTLDFPQSWFEFGHIRRRVFTEQRETYHVGVPSFSLEVATLPETGRPPDFSGGVGYFEAQADVSRRDIDLGESIKLTVDWTGEANLEFFDLPSPSRLEAFSDFRVYGSTNDRFYGDRRRVVYDLAPKSADVLEIPPLPLVVFDPELGEYRTISTRPIPIRVRALEGGGGLADEEGAGGGTLYARDIQTQSETSDGTGGGAGGLVAGAWIGVPGLWLLARTLRRRRGDPDAPAARRRRAAVRRLKRDLQRARDARDQAHALYEFLGARSGEEPEAWEGRDVEGWFAEHELASSAESLERLVAVGAELDARRWAGDLAKLDDTRVRTAAEGVLQGGF